jgi:hypothetical protein
MLDPINIIFYQGFLVLLLKLLCWLVFYYEIVAKTYYTLYFYGGTIGLLYFIYTTSFDRK